MHFPPSRRPLMPAIVCTAALTMTAACGSPEPTKQESRAGYPVTVSNCGIDQRFDAPPERGLLLKSASVPYLDAIGALDRITAKAGVYPKAYYNADTNAALERIPSLTDKMDSSGHLQISMETVLARSPDLVLGHTDTVNPKTLASTKVPVLEVPALCEGASKPPTFDDVYAELQTYGKVFGKQQQATRAVTSMRGELSKITSNVPDRKGATAAVLYPTPGGGTTYAYGNRSMADPQLAAAGFKNVFAGVAERVFEISPEQLLAKNPDVIVLLHNEGNPQEIERAMTSLPGAGRLAAVRNKRIHVQLFNFTEPPSPLAITGLKKIVNAFPTVR